MFASRDTTLAKEDMMSTILVGLLSVGAPLVAFGLYDLQKSLERWDYERHASD